MKLDSEDQRTMLLELISAASFSGSFLDTVYNLKKAIQDAELAELEEK